MPLGNTRALAQVPPLDPAQGQQWIPNYQQIVAALNGLTLAGLLFAAGVVVIGGATWALAANRAHTQGVTWGRFMVIGGFVGAVVIGAASAIVNAGFRLGSGPDAGRLRRPDRVAAVVAGRVCRARGPAGDRGGWLVWQGLTRAGVSRPERAPALESHDPAAPVAWGAPELVEGVPWGFPLTSQGAVAAAVTAVAVTGQPDAVFDPARFSQVAAAVFTDAEAAAQARQVEAARTEFELSGWASQPPSRRLYFFAPLAARLVAYDHASPFAQVEVWAMTLVGVGDAGGAVFTTPTVTLQANGETWTVTGLDTVEGSTPLVHTTASAPGRTRALLRDATATWPLPPVEPQP